MADAPVLNTPTSMSATTISLSWTQPGSDVDSYTVSFSYTIRQCDQGVMIGPTRSDIEGSDGSYQLRGLEEDSDYTISLTANIAAGPSDSNWVSATTSTAGKTINLIMNYYCQCNIMQFLVVDP